MKSFSGFLILVFAIAVTSLFKVAITKLPRQESRSLGLHDTTSTSQTEEHFNTNPAPGSVSVTDPNLSNLCRLTPPIPRLPRLPTQQNSGSGSGNGSGAARVQTWIPRSSTWCAPSWESRGHARANDVVPSLLPKLLPLTPLLPHRLVAGRLTLWVCN